MISLDHRCLSAAFLLPQNSTKPLLIYYVYTSDFVENWHDSRLILEFIVDRTLIRDYLTGL